MSSWNAIRGDMYIDFQWAHVSIPRDCWRSKNDLANAAQTLWQSIRVCHCYTVHDSPNWPHPTAFLPIRVSSVSVAPCSSPFRPWNPHSWQKINLSWCYPHIASSVGKTIKYLHNRHLYSLRVERGRPSKNAHPWPRGYWYLQRANWRDDDECYEYEYCEEDNKDQRGLSKEVVHH